MRIKTVLFDIDGTLLDHTAAVTASLDTFYAEHRGRIGLPPAEFKKKWFGLIDIYYPQFAHGKITNREQRIVRVKACLGDDLTDDRAYEFFTGYLAIYEKHWNLFPDVLPCLDALKDLPLGIITNGDDFQQNKKLRKTGLASRFTSIVTSDRAGSAKPGAAVFNLALQEMNGSPGSAVYIGDDPGNDVKGALAAGVTPVWINRTGEPAMDGILQCDSLDAVPGILETL